MEKAETSGNFVYIPDDDEDDSESQNSLSESGGEGNCFSEHYVTSFKTSECVESAPPEKEKDPAEKNTEANLKTNDQDEAAVSDLYIDEELELAIDNLELNENMENDICFEELLSED
ncbi:UNVERIFIED_CONTAM: hypothetical protein NCL1_34850 [Trichonephila clavipes]